MRVLVYLSAIVSVFVFAGSAMAHPGHDPQGSPHHDLSLILIPAVIVAVLFALSIMKPSVRSKKNTVDINDR
jgi:NADH:ubiquinone oxidoreductase subunit 6 (subunit J)